MNQGNNHIAKLIDHTYLKTDGTKVILDKLVKEAQRYHFNSICIRSNWIKEYADQYRCSATIGFPEQVFVINSQEDLLAAKNAIGNINIMDKLSELRQAILDGAQELDPVIDLNQFSHLERELNAYIILIDSLNLDRSIYLKPIFSCELLSDREIEQSVKIFAEAVANYYTLYSNPRIKFAYKNSTGFVKSERVALRTTSPDLVRLIANLLDKYDKQKYITIKAAGGIRSYEDAIAVEAAASGRLSHIGTSSGVAIQS